MTLYQGGAIKNNIEKSRIEANEAVSRTDQYDHNLIIKILQYFLNALSSEELLRFQKVIIETSEEQLRQGEEKYKVGTILESDYLILQAQKANDECNLLNSQINRDNALLNLKLALSMDPNAELTLVYPDTTDMEAMSAMPSVETAIQRTLDTHPDIILAKSNIEVQRINEEITRAGRRPTVSASAGLSTGHRNFDDFGNQLVDRFSQSLGVSMSVPIYDRGKTKTSLKMNEIQTKMSELDLQDAELKLRQTVAVECANVELAYRQYTVNEKRAKAYKAVYDAYNMKFKYGTITSVDLLQQQNNYIKAMALRKLVATYVKMLNKYMPEDIEGEIIVDNQSYNKSVEHALICVRSLVARWFADEVSESLGRPLTENEQIIASQILAGKTGNQRECLYCYVASDRASYRASFGAYFLRYAGVAKAASENKEAYQAEIDFLQSDEGKAHLKKNTNKDRIFGKKYDGPLKNFADFLNGSAATEPQIERYINFVKDGLNGENNLDASDLTTKTKRAEIIKAVNELVAEGDSGASKALTSLETKHSIDGVALRPEDYTKWVKDEGQTETELREKLFEQDWYNSSSSGDKLDLVTGAKKLAKAIADYHLTGKESSDSDFKLWLRSGEDVDNYLEAKRTEANFASTLAEKGYDPSHPNLESVGYYISTLGDISAEEKAKAFLEAYKNGDPEQLKHGKKKKDGTYEDGAYEYYKNGEWEKMLNEYDLSYSQSDTQQPEIKITTSSVKETPKSAPKAQQDDLELKHSRGDYSDKLRGVTESGNQADWVDAEKAIPFLDKNFATSSPETRGEILWNSGTNHSKTLNTVKDTYGMSGVNDYYTYFYEANADGNSKVSKDEAIAYLNTTDLSAKEKNFWYHRLVPTSKKDIW